MADTQEKTTEVVKQKTDDTKAAEALLLADKKRREDVCADEINNALVKYNCKLNTQMILSAGSITPQVDIISN